MRKKLIVAGILILLLTLIAAIACAEISNIKFSQTKKGHVKVTWKDSGGKGPYVVSYTISSWKSGNWCEEDEYDERSATLHWLVPGATYKITVRRADWTSSKTKTYEVPQGTFMDWDFNKSVVVQNFRKLTIGQDSLNKKLELRVYYPRLKKLKEYFVLIALRTPKGYTRLVHYDSAFTPGRKTTYSYYNLDLAEWMRNVKETFGKYPKGEYKFMVFMDGAYYQGGNFFVY